MNNVSKIAKRTIVAAVALAYSFGGSILYAKELTIASSGGSWQEAQNKALWAPAAKTLGIRYTQDTFQNWAEARAQVESGSINWDIVQISLTDEPKAKSAGILESFPPDTFKKADFVPGSTTEYFVANSNFSTVIAWNKKTYGDNGPKSMADFFDTKKFPGKRSLWNQPTGMIEAAALALGTPRNEVYEFLSTQEGRRAAIEKLNDLAPHISVWWESGAQAAQLIKDGEVDMILTWSGRVQGAIADGANFGFTFNDGQIGTDGYVVLKGAPNREEAVRFLKEISKPQYQMNLPNAYATAPANIRAYELASYSPEQLATMASAPQNLALQYEVNPNFWLKYAEWGADAYDTVRMSH